MRKQFKQLISTILATVIAVQSCPFKVSAADSIAADDTAVLEPVVESYDIADSVGKPSEVVTGEVSSLREESVKHFRMEDGSFVAINYGLPVHYSTDGETWEDIDNTLISTASGDDGNVAVMSQGQASSNYTAENGDRTTTFSGDLSDGFLFSSSRGQVGIAFALPGDSAGINENEEIVEEPVIELIPNESEPSNLSREEGQSSISVTLEATDSTKSETEPPEVTEAVEESEASQLVQETKPVEETEVIETTETSLTEETTEPVDAEDGEKNEVTEPTVENEPAEPTEQTVPTVPVEETTEPTVESQHSAENIETVEATDPTDENEPYQESTEATEPTYNTEETASSDDTILTETEESIVEPEESVIEETDVVVRQFDRTVVAQISYPDQENTEVETGDASTMGISQESGVSDEEPDLMDQVYPEKLRTNILYEDVYPGVDLLYEMYSVHVKESIIIKEKLEDYTFTFELNLAGLTPILQDNGSIILTDEDNTVIYRMPAPFMFDNLGIESDNVEYYIEELSDGLWELSVIADPEWINDEGREFPVTIDPTLIEDMSSNLFIYSLTSENTYDVTEKSNIACGYHANSSDGSNYGQIETYFRVSLPEIAPGNTVVRAYVNFNQNDFIPRTESSSLIVYMSEITESVALGSERPDLDGDGDGDMRWSDRPDIAELYLDYMTLSWGTLDDNIRWDVTSAAKGWYAGKPNYGLAMTSNGNATTQCRAWFTYNSQAAFIVAYRSTIGVEPYYTYQTLDIGNAGTAYIGDFSGNLTVSKQLVHYASAVNPVAIELIYNSFYPANYNVASAMGYEMNLGYSMMLNLMQKIDEPTIANAATSYLRWTDGDGTQHYFAQNNDGTGYYYDEDGLGLKIKKFTGYYKMYDDKGNTMTFTSGFLTNITDANGNQIKINLSSGKITSVTQLNNIENPETVTVATFTYDSSNILTGMTDAAGNVFVLNYSGGYLVSLTRNGTTIMRYSLPDGAMNFAYDLEAGYGIAFRYTNGMISEYFEITEIAEGGLYPPVAGAVVAVEHTSNGQVKYRHCGVDQAADEADADEKNDIITCYTFDYAGRSVNCYSTDADDNLIGATNAVYSGVGTTAKDNNRTMRTATIGSIAAQLLVNAGFESGSSGWTVSSASIGTTKPKTGAYGYVGTSSSSMASRTVTLTAGTHTISGYVNTSAASINSASCGVYIEVLNSSNTQVAKTNLVHYKTSSDIENGWVRVSDTFTATAGTYTVRIRNNGVTGSVYVDDLLLEKGEAASNVNLLENGNFESGISDWTHNGGSLASASGIELSKALKITGDPNTGCYAAKTVTLNMSGEYTYVLSGWGKGKSVPDTTGTEDWTKAFGIRAKINYSDGTYEYQFAPFNTDVEAWQFTSVAVVPNTSKTVSSITVVCGYEKNVNYAFFDNLALVLDPAQTMTYDSNGELKSVATSGSSTDTYSYSGSDLIEAVTEGSGTFNYTYDSKHNLKTATNGIVTQSYGYSSAGNLTSTTLTGSSTSAKITSSAAYSTDGNQLTKTTDSRNYSTTYVYEQNAYKQYGVPTQVTDAKSVARRTIIDTIGRPTSEYIASTISLTYAYTKGMLSQIARGGWIPNDSNKKTQNYNLTYDSMNRLHKVDIGTRNMVTNTYNALSFLTKQTFGNTQSTTYTYDDLGRVKTMTQADGAVTTYNYSSDGKLSMIESGSDTYRYVYDSLDRLISSDWLSSVTTKLQTYHQYDTSNRLTKQTVNLVDKTYTEIYNYDDYGRLSSMTAGNSSSISVAYDGLSRISTVTKPAAKATYTYLAGSGTNVTTGLVSKLAYAANGNSFSAVNYSYTYDALGNILSYTDSSNSSNSREYEYDAQGQLVYEKTSGGAIIGYYTYDTYGNIRSYSNGVSTINYTYGNSEWLDLLTAYNGGSITYDTIGNPTSYYNGIRWDFDWRNGRELYQATKNVDEDTSVTVNYDYDMNGLRTGKTVVTVTQGSNGTHSYTSTVVAPTCTTGGYTRYQCACGASYQDNAVAALGHNYSQTSTSSGVQYTCSRCGDSYMEHTHSYTDTVIAPTCTVGGYTLHECSCGHSYQDSETAARGHFYNKIGETYICTRCGHSYTAHTHSYTETIVSPTCTEGGYTLYECSCGYSYQGNETAARGHFYNSTVSGYICTRCGHTTTTLNASAGEYEISTVEETAAVSSDTCPANPNPDVTETVTHSYIYAGGKLVRETYGNVTLDFLYDQNGNPYAMSYKATANATPVYYYYILNLQGDVVRLVDTTGATVADYSYNAWGKCTVTPASSTYTTVANANPLRYRGYYYDSESGFYYLQSRYYDPQIGRFINADQFASTGQDFIGYNMFAYCNNNPINYEDSSGCSLFPSTVVMNDSTGGTYHSGTISNLDWEDLQDFPNNLAQSYHFSVVHEEKALSNGRTKTGDVISCSITPFSISNTGVSIISIDANFLSLDIETNNCAISLFDLGNASFSLGMNEIFPSFEAMVSLWSPSFSFEIFDKSVTIAVYVGAYGAVVDVTDGFEFGAANGFGASISFGN